MARIAVLHNTLDFQGGADAVCLNTCRALQDAHDVTLFTISETSPSALGSRFGTSVDVPVQSPPRGTAVARGLSVAAPWVGPQLAFRSVLLHRHFRRVADRFDLAVSTANEFALSIPSVQYVHYPQFNHHLLSDADGGRLNRVWSWLAGPDARLYSADTTLLANSAWTADAVADVYGKRPDVLHPPVEPISGGLPWNEREDGVVVVGRLAPDKRVLDAVEVVDGVRDRGHDVHLHVVGSAPRAYRRYVDRVAAAADAREYVSLERDASRSRLVELLRTHKYGLNTKPAEPFGMALAEYVSAGMVAFAPDDGGQRDVLGGRSDRLFDSVETAVSLVSDAVAADDPPVGDPGRFDPARFHESIRRRVEETLA